MSEEDKDTTVRRAELQSLTNEQLVEHARALAMSLAAARECLDACERVLVEGERDHG